MDVERGIRMYTRRLQYHNIFRSWLDPERGLQNAGPPGRDIIIIWGTLVVWSKCQSNEYIHS